MSEEATTEATTEAETGPQQGGGGDRARLTSRLRVRLNAETEMEMEFRVWEDVSVPGDVLPDYRLQRRPVMGEMAVAATQAGAFLEALAKGLDGDVRLEGGPGA